MNAEDRKYWVRVGRTAFANGEHRAPALNGQVRRALEGMPVGTKAAVDIMLAFGRGWDAANLEAPVE